jgi:hypothetical protein
LRQALLQWINSLTDFLADQLGQPRIQVVAVLVIAPSV